MKQEQSAKYLLDDAGLAALRSFMDKRTLFAFDLDGTLAPIVTEYSAAGISELVRETMEQLVKLAEVAVITGRSRKDALNILGFEPHLVVGNHGAEWPHESGLSNHQFARFCASWRNKLQEQLTETPGIEIEFKGESLALHYRKTADQETALRCIDTAIASLTPSPRRIGGKYVVNLVPEEAFTKGEALMAAMDSFGLKRVIYFGDDVTDEDVFQLRHIDLFGVHIGKDEETAASYYLNEQSQMPEILNSIIGIIESRNECTAR